MDAGPELNKVQQNLQNALNPILKSAIVAGLQIDNVALSTSPTDVDHKLGRLPQGWLLVDRSSDATVWATAKNKSVLTLTASAATVVSLWVY